MSKIASFATLALVLFPCLLFCAGVIGLDATKWAALVGTIGWFIATPIWMSRELTVDVSQVEI